MSVSIIHTRKMQDLVTFSIYREFPVLVFSPVLFLVSEFIASR